MNKDNSKIPGFRTYFFVWVGLIILTALTVIISQAGFGTHGALSSVTIAFVKSGLILLFFMHLKQEGLILKALLFLPLATIAIIIGLTFFDIWYRY
jgi:cytochrome c oxidase subunit 4